MKVKELIDHLQKLDQEAEVRISIRKGYRPYGFTRPLTPLEPVFDQDTNRVSYSIDVNIIDHEKYSETEEKLIIPENKTDEEYK